jgi:hypothetical protein
VQRRPDARLVISAGKAPSARADGLAAAEEARQVASRLGLLDQTTVASPLASTHGGEHHR